MTGPRVELADVRSAVLMLLDELEHKYGPTIDLDGDYYWDLDPDVAFDPTKDPANGSRASQLSDDVESLHELLQRGEDDVVVVWHDLAHLVGILRRLAHLDQSGPPSLPRARNERNRSGLAD